MSIIVPLSQETTKAVPVHVEVDAERGGGTVTMSQYLPADFDVTGYLLVVPGEARALAAALLHYADEAER